MQTKILDSTENCKSTTLTEPKSAKPTGQSVGALLECVVTKDSLLSAEEQMFWSSSDALKLSLPTGKGKHLNKYIPNGREEFLAFSLHMQELVSP